MREFHEAADRMRAWFDQHFDNQGVFTLDPDNPRCYFKAPFIMGCMGLRGKGARVVKHVGERFLEPSGDLVGGPGFDMQNRVFGMGWLALGAMTVGRFDAAQRLAQRLAERLDPQCGAYILPDAALGQPTGGLLGTGGAAMGLVAGSRLSEAQRVAERLASHFVNQPEPRRLYRKFHRDGSIATEGPAFDLDLDVDLDKQGSSHLTPLVVALVWLGRATHDRKHFDTASQYVEFVYGNKHDPATFVRSSNFGWAMLELYEDTGDRRLLERAVRLGEALVSWQSADGMWDARPTKPGSDAPVERLAYSADCGMTVLALEALPEP